MDRFRAVVACRLMIPSARPPGQKVLLYVPAVLENHGQKTNENGTRSTQFEAYVMQAGAAPGVKQLLLRFHSHKVRQRASAHERTTMPNPVEHWQSGVERQFRGRMWVETRELSLLSTRLVCWRTLGEPRAAAETKPARVRDEHSRTVRSPLRI